MRKFEYIYIKNLHNNNLYILNIWRDGMTPIPGSGRWGIGLHRNKLHKW